MAVTEPQIETDGLQPGVTVIIPTLESERSLVQTLAPLVSGATAGLITEVIVADAGGRISPDWRPAGTSPPIASRTGGSPARLQYLPAVTRECFPGAFPVRIPALLEDGRLEQAAGLELDPQRARIMVCGNPHMARELRRQLTQRGFRTNRRAAPGQLGFENYWTTAS